jgi:hypothetical protein
MHPLSNSASKLWIIICVVLLRQITYVSGYFIIENPEMNTQWVNNVSNLVAWTKGVADGVDGFDIEMTRLSEDGLTLVARNVPAVPPQINLMLIDVPPGDDYFLLFVNSTIGQRYVTSSQFTILAASATPSVAAPSPARGAATITVSGGPNPTLPFATTFPPLPGGAVALFTTIQANTFFLMLLGCALGTFLTIC